MRILVPLLVLLSCFQGRAQEGEAPFEGKKSPFHGFDCYDFEHGGVACKVVTPKEAAAGNPWIWRARFFDHEPQLDKALLEKGYHVAYCDVGNLFGAPAAVERWNKFYQFLTEEKAFHKKPALEGMSRGGLIIYNWAKKNPGKVSCIYGDAPVCDIKSWPRGSAGAWAQCLKAYGFKDDAEALAFKGNPIDGLEPLAEAKVPLLHVVGDADDVVPVEANTAVLAKRYKALGGEIEVIHKPGVGHHPHSLKDPAKLVEFVTKHVKPATDGEKKNSVPGVRFDPVVKEMEGWKVHIDPELLEGQYAVEGAKSLRMLGDHLNRISLLMNDDQLKKMRTCEIWIERYHPSLGNMQYHPGLAWLKNNGHDPRLVKKVHIPRAAALLERSQLLKHPAVVLHELAHAYHDQILDFDEASIVAAWKTAMKKGIYDRVLLFNGKLVKHYATTNHKEYFAESTEAYFYRNDFYPFVRAELKEHDPIMHGVMEKVWGILK